MDFVLVSSSADCFFLKVDVSGGASGGGGLRRFILITSRRCMAMMEIPLAQIGKYLCASSGPAG